MCAACKERATVVLQMIGEEPPKTHAHPRGSDGGLVVSVLFSETLVGGLTFQLVA